MIEAEIKKLFIEKEAMLEGHFLLTSGRHSEVYLQCALVLQHPQVAEMLGEALVEQVKAETGGISARVDAVVGPAIGGIILGHVVARALKARCIFAEREAGAGPLKLRRGFYLKPGESVLCVEDVITTGGSLKEVVSLAQNAGAKVTGVAAVAERSTQMVSFGVSKSVLLKLPIKDYLPEECPKCKEGIPAVKPGSRA